MHRQNQKLMALLQPVVRGLGCELLGMEYLSKRGGRLRLYIDADRGVSVADCARVSEQVQAVLEVAEPFPGGCALEISSPGLERPLFTLEQAARWLGHAAEVSLLGEMRGRRRLRGRLLAAGNGIVKLSVDEAAENENNEWEIPAGQISRMRLVSE